MAVSDTELISTPVSSPVKYRWWQRVVGLLRMTHFFPNLVVLTATLVLGIVASRGELELGTLLRVWLVVLCGHSTIGITNDYLDRHRDAIAQPYKPLPSGLVGATFTRNFIIILMVIEAALAFTLGSGATLLALVATASGLMYDFYLKDSYLSWVPYLLSFTSLPLFIWAGLDRFEPKLLWLYPPALLLVIGLNLANSLPDIATDIEKHQSRGLGHLLGQQRALVALWLLFTATPLLGLTLTPLVTYNKTIFWPAAALAILIVLASIIYYRFRRDRAALVVIWQLMIISGFSTGVGWLAALTLS